MKKRKRKNKKICIVIILLFFCSFIGVFTYARYVSKASDNDEVRVAQAGSITLVEKLNDVIQTNNEETLNIIDYEITPGVDIDKEVYLEFINSEVSTYLFLVIDSMNWTYNENLNEFSVLNERTKLLSFNINENWTYLDNLSSDDKFIFYIDYAINDNTKTKFDIMNQITTGIIGVDDIEKLNNTQIKFSAYSIQKSSDLSVEDAWGYLN